MVDMIHKFLRQFRLSSTMTIIRLSEAKLIQEVVANTDNFSRYRQFGVSHFYSNNIIAIQFFSS